MTKKNSTNIIIKDNLKCCKAKKIGTCEIGIDFLLLVIAFSKDFFWARIKENFQKNENTIIKLYILTKSRLPKFTPFALKIL